VANRVRWCSHDGVETRLAPATALTRLGGIARSPGTAHPDHPATSRAGAGRRQRGPTGPVDARAPGCDIPPRDGEGRRWRPRRTQRGPALAVAGEDSTPLPVGSSPATAPGPGRAWSCAAWTSPRRTSTGTTSSRRCTLSSTARAASRWTRHCRWPTRHCDRDACAVRVGAQGDRCRRPGPAPRAAGERRRHRARRPRRRPPAHRGRVRVVGVPLRTRGVPVRRSALHPHDARRLDRRTAVWEDVMYHPDEVRQTLVDAVALARRRGRSPCAWANTLPPARAHVAAQPSGEADVVCSLVHAASAARVHSVREGGRAGPRPRPGRRCRTAPPRARGAGSPSRAGGA